jgi:hypothetical protein
MSEWSPDDETSPDLTPEQREQAEAMAKEFAQARQAILEADPSAIVANHAFGIYELAALHVTSDDPDLDAARLAIDALGALLDGVEGRLGEAEPTLLEALHNIKLGYVQRVSATRAATDSGDQPASSSDDEEEAEDL